MFYFNHINNEILSHTGDHICQILGLIVILMTLASRNNILTIWRFIPLFWRFLDIKNLHHNVYFNTLKATLSFIFALHLLLLNIYVSGNEEWSIIVLCNLRTLVMISLYFMPFLSLKSRQITKPYTKGVPHMNSPIRKRILSIRYCAIHWQIDHIWMCSPRKTSIR